MPLREEENDVLILWLVSLVALHVCHFTPELCQMQERKTELGVRGGQGGALAVPRFFSAKAASISLGSVPVAHRCSQENYGARAYRATANGPVSP